MPTFHQRTLSLLGGEGRRPERSVTALLRWAAEQAITLPAAFVEWAKLDDGSLLRKYSNDDGFWFDRPRMMVTPEGVRGLLFHQENQGNFDRIVALDQGDDPPVLFAWIGRPPWVTYTNRFSDAVFAQVFDWQYLLEFRAGEPAFKEMTDSREINLQTDHCLEIMRQRFEEVVATRFIVEGRHYAEYRFLKSPRLRMTVMVDEDHAANVRVTGASVAEVDRLVTELETDLGADHEG